MSTPDPNQITPTNPSPALPALDTLLEYDGDGNLLKETLPDGSTRRLTQVTLPPIEAGQPQAQMNYQYLCSCQLADEGAQPDPDGAGPLVAPVTTYEYDVDNNLVKITGPGGRVTRYV
jgi:uncharacterized protein RhaS with RHS repeats